MVAKDWFLTYCNLQIVEKGKINKYLDFNYLEMNITFETLIFWIDAPFVQFGVKSTSKKFSLIYPPPLSQFP